MAWKSETLIVGGKEVKGVQVREGSPYSIVKLDTRRMSDEEEQAVKQYFAPGTQKEWSEWNNTYLRVQSTLLKYPEIRGRMEQGQPDAAPEPVVTTGTEPQEYVYQGEIAGKQLPYLRRWAAERGARIEEYNPTSTPGGTVFQYRIISKGDLLERQKIQRDIERELFRPTAMQEKVGGFTPTDRLVMTVPSVETIEKKEREATIQQKAREIVEKSGPAARLRTLLSPAGEEYIGATLLGKDPTYVVQKKIEQELRLQMAEGPKQDAFTRGVIEAVQSPVVEVELAALGGAGFAKLGATKLGGKILATKAAKIALGAGAVYYIGSTGAEVYTDIQMGKVEAAVGRVATTAAALGAGFAGAKAGAKYYAKAPATVEAEIQTGKTKGVSLSRPETPTEPAMTAGAFETKLKVGGKEIPVKGYIVGVGKSTGKGKALQKVKILIPEQKVGKISIKETTLLRSGRALKTGADTFRVDVSEGIIINTRAGKVDIILAGSRRGTGYYIERASVKVGDKTIRAFTGSATETAGKTRIPDIERAVRLAGKGIPGERIGDVPRVDVKMKSIQDIKWIDISEPRAPPATKPLVKGWPGALPDKPVKGPAPSLKVAEAPAPVAPAGKVSVTGTREALGLPTFTVTATVAATAATGTVARSARKGRVIASIPDVKVEAKGMKEREIATMNKAATVQLPKSMREGKQKQKAKPATDVYSRNVPDVDVSMAQATKQAQAVTSKQAVKAPARSATDIVIPAVAPPVIETQTPPILINLPGGIKIRSGYAGKAKYKLKTVVNPIPAQLDIKLPKIKGV